MVPSPSGDGERKKKQSFDQEESFVKKRSHILTQNQELNQEVTETFQEMLQKTAQRALIALMEREVENICGESYHPVEGQQYRRAGSVLGRAYYNGQSHSVRRPRVRERGEDGREQETHLKSYEASRSRKHLNEEILKMVEGGMTLRGIERMGREGCSASTAQKAWVEESAKSIVQLRERDLSKESFYCLMMDGVVLTSTQRHTTPFPDLRFGSDRRALNTVRRVDRWLWDNGVAEARARGDRFNLHIFESLNPDRLSQSDKDSLEYYLFDPQFVFPVAHGLLG